MITNIEGAGATHGWSDPADFEHEVRLSDGRLADLKALYGVDSLCVDASSLTLMMSDESRTSVLRLTWDGLSLLRAETVGPVLPGDDGRTGIIGVRLLGRDHEDTRFEIEMDWLRLHVTARTLSVDEAN